MIYTVIIILICSILFLSSIIYLKIRNGQKKVLYFAYGLDMLEENLQLAIHGKPKRILKKVWYNGKAFIFTSSTYKCTMLPSPSYVQGTLYEITKNQLDKLCSLHGKDSKFIKEEIGKVSYIHSKEEEAIPHKHFFRLEANFETILKDKPESSLVKEFIDVTNRCDPDFMYSNLFQEI